jgi:hypothetical protein
MNLFVEAPGITAYRTPRRPGSGLQIDDQIELAARIDGVQRALGGIAEEAPNRSRQSTVRHRRPVILLVLVWLGHGGERIELG